MAKNTKYHAETTCSGRASDVLGDVLSSMRVNGNVLLHEAYSPPWAIAIPSANNLHSLLNLDAGIRVVAFHFVKRGFIDITPEGTETIALEAGEMAICFGGSAHRLSQGDYQQTIAVESLLTGENNPFQPAPEDKARSTSLICGVFMMKNIALNPLFSSLPPFLRASTSHTNNAHNLTSVLNWMSQEIDHDHDGRSFVIERLLELLCMEALRSYLDTAPSESKWLSSLKDPIVGKAISLIHTHPIERWTVKQIAQAVSISPSRFSARFAAAVGDSPMAYLTKWRMNLAGRLLLDEPQKTIEAIASEVGYENVTAFTRAFKRHLNMPPTRWRALSYQT